MLHKDVYYLIFTTLDQATQDLRQFSVYEILKKKVKMCDAVSERGKSQVIHIRINDKP